MPSGLRRQFQVDVSLFLIFFVFFLYVRRAPDFLRPMDKGRARAVGELVAACYLRVGVSTRSRRSLRTRIEGTSAIPGRKLLRSQFQVSSQLTAPQTRGEQSLLKENS